MKIILRILFSFRGSADRKTWWLFAIFYWITMLPVAVWLEGLAKEGPLFFCLTFLFFFFYMWPFLAVHARRFHDLGKSGLCCLVYLLPFGFIWVVFQAGFAPSVEDEEDENEQ